MKRFSPIYIMFVFILAVALCAAGASDVLAAKPDKAKKPAASAKASGVNAAFDAAAMSDMSDYNPARPVIPTGDTIKIAVVAPFSGPAQLNGQMYFASVQWVAHDINKRGGLLVDGKKKLVQIIKADHMSKPDQCKKICERMALQEKVHFFWGTSGSNMMKIINEVANKYKIISQNCAAITDDLNDLENYGRYQFMSCFTTDQIGRGLAYYYGQIRKKESKFYILCQDYSYGRDIADSFKQGLKEYFPTAKIVGEDYHKLFLTDFAPYLTKIKASGAEVIYTGDWHPDAGTLLKQARQMGIRLPFANVYMTEPNMLHEVGVEGTAGLVNIDAYNLPSPCFKTPGQIKYYKTWNNQWKNVWKTPPFNSRLFEHGAGSIGSWVMNTYWLMSVIERAQSTDPEKIIKVWEGDSYQAANGKILRMRACDHKEIQDLTVLEYVTPEKQKVAMNIPPYYWYKGTSYIGPGWRIPAEKILPPMDRKIPACKGKNPGF